jgi:hypothetical protein
MTHRSNPYVQTAAQYLIWAIEEIEKIGNPEAAHHARIALDALRRAASGT